MSVCLLSVFFREPLRYRTCMWVCVSCSVVLFVTVYISGTHRKKMMPVFDMAYDRPRMPLPMMALLRLKTDIPKEVLPSNWKRHMTIILTSKTQYHYVMLRGILWHFITSHLSIVSKAMQYLSASYSQIISYHIYRSLLKHTLICNCFSVVFMFFGENNAAWIVFSHFVYFSV